jgi:hypothetical protein
VFLNRGSYGGKSRIYTTTDAGISWYYQSLEPDASGIAIAPDQTIHVLSSDVTGPNYLQGKVYTSTDLGQTFTSSQSLVDGDSFTLAVDSCDRNMLYLANEDYATPDNDSSEIYVSSDAGISWETTFSHQTYYLSGVLATTKNVLYAGCIDSLGILRSTDRGKSWKNIGGPSLRYDCHGIALAGDQIVFVLDQFGNIWRTTNSGGDSLKDFPVVRLATNDVHADTIGTNFIQIPIIIQNMNERRDAECVLHYAPVERLMYQGTFSKSSVPLDISGEQWTGHSKLYIPKASSSDTILGYARFIVRADTTMLPKVWFDSLWIDNTIIPCAIYDQYVASKDVATSNIIIPSGCGTPILSEYIRTKHILAFSIRPNPVQESINLELNSVTDQTATIELINPLGVVLNRFEHQLTIGTNTIRLDIKDYLAGAYYLRIRSNEGETGQMFVVGR